MIEIYVILFVAASAPLGFLRFTLFLHYNIFIRFSVFCCEAFIETKPRCSPAVRFLFFAKVLFFLKAPASV